jgi:membrane-associated protease RseP (regulator of RpoE activity)
LNHPEDNIHLEPEVIVPESRVATHSKRFDKRLWLSVLLFAVTFVSAMWSQTVNWSTSGDLLEPFYNPSKLLEGLPFACTLMTILLAHELGHYFEARRLGIDHSLPYFIPAPTFFGTLGAVITMRSQPANRSALFRVALAGPYMGLLVAIPATAWGLAHSHVVPPWQAASVEEPIMGSSLLFQLLAKGFAPHGDYYELHQVALAGWVGLFITSLNLIPASQLDGGHLIYTLFPRMYRKIATCVVIGLFAIGMYLGVNGGGVWLMWAMLLSIMGLRHPPVRDEATPLSKYHKLHALVACSILIATFIPVPIHFVSDDTRQRVYEEMPPQEPFNDEEEPRQQNPRDEEPQQEEFRL